MFLEIVHHGQNAFPIQPNNYDVFLTPKVIIYQLVYQICFEKVGTNEL